MKFSDKLQDWLNLTKNEKKVLLFLSVTFLIGAGLNFYKSNFQKDEIPILSNPSFDSAFVQKAKIYSSTSNDVLPNKININTASKEDLMKLPGIGEEMAERILIYKRENGSFKNIAKLKNIKGIGEKKFNKLSKLIFAE